MALGRICILAVGDHPRLAIPQRDKYNRGVTGEATAKNRKLRLGLAWALAAVAALLFLVATDLLAFKWWLLVCAVVTGLEVLVASRVSKNLKKELVVQVRREMTVWVFLAWAVVALFVIFIVVLAFRHVPASP